MTEGVTQHLLGEPRSNVTGARARGPRSLLLATVAIAVALSSVACSGSSKRQATYVPEGFQPDLAHYALPLDSYLPDTAEKEFALNLLVQPCMQSASIDWPIPGLASKFRPPSLNANLRMLFTLDNAKKYGYHLGPAPRRPDPMAGRTLTRVEQARFDVCGKAARDKIVNEGIQDLIEGLRFAAQQTASQGPTTRRLAKEWRTCMLAAGQTDVPEDPMGMPTPAQWRKWNPGPPDLGDSDIKRPQIGGPEEIRVAIIDVTCRESSGYAAGSYQAEVDAQIALMADNQNALERALENTKRANAVIQEAIRKQHG